MLYPSALKLACASSHQIEVYIHDNIRNFTSVLYCGMNERVISKSIFILLNLRKSESLISKINLA